MTAVTVGNQYLPESAVFFGAPSSSMRDIAFYIWHLELDGRHYLVDTGPPRAPEDFAALDASGLGLGPECGFRNARHLQDVLQHLELRPDQIDAVLVTQPIVYHSGGLEPDLLPRAQVYIALDGVLELLLDPPGHPDAQLYFTATSWDFLRTLAVERRLHLVAEHETVADGLEFVVTGGHHPGSAAVLLARDGGTTALVETAFVQANVAEGRPIGLAENLAKARSAVARLSRTCDRVIAIHEPANETGFPSR